MAPWVRWSGPNDPITGPLAVFVGETGGALDHISADVDVTTFLNDRFTAFFVPPDQTPLAPGAWFLTEAGCTLAGPLHPTTPGEWIAAANAALLMPPGDVRCPTEARAGWGFPLPARHPLIGPAGHPIRR